MSVLGCNIRTRNTSGGVRVLTIVPYGHDSNEVLLKVMDDIIYGVTNGIPSVDAYGNRVLIFLDNVTIFGDTLKINAITDTMGHSALSFCNYCFVRKQNVENGPSYCYTTMVNGRTIPFQRLDEKSDILRQLRLTNNEKALFGMTSTSDENASDIPTVYMSNKLLEKRAKIPNTNEGTPVVSHLFESSRSISVAPDHLITGLISNLIEMCLHSLPSVAEIWKFQSFVLSTSAENNLPMEGSFVLITDNSFRGISTLSMSTLYVLLLCSTAYFRTPLSPVDGNVRPFSMCKTLQDYVSLFYYWPTKYYDLDNEIDSVRGDNGHKYLSSLHTLSQSFVESSSSFIKEDGNNCRLLDKPNIHRLLELTVTTLPLFGHGRILSELVFEMVHFFFKKWFEENPHSDSHLSAIDLALSRNWCSNFYVAYNIYRFGTDSERPLASNSLLRLVFGQQVLEHIEPPQCLKGLFEEFFQRLDGLFKPPVKTLLEDCVPSTFIDSMQEYRCNNSIKTCSLEDNRLCWGLEIISEHLQLDLETAKNEFRLFENCSLITIDKYKSGSHSYPYRTIKVGTAVTVLVPTESDSEHLIISNNQQTSTNCKRLLTAVMYIMNLRHHNWIIGLRMIPQGGFHAVSKHDVIVIRISTCVQRVGLVHQCTSECNIQQGRLTVHKNGLLDGGLFKVLLRKDGFPPFLG